MDRIAPDAHRPGRLIGRAVGRRTAHPCTGSSTAPWSEERDDGRILVSSTTGAGWDASRILLPDAVAHLATVLGAGGSARVLVAFPAPDLLIATALPAGETEFGRLFGEFVIAYAEDADDPIDERIFELREDSLIPFEA